MNKLINSVYSTRLYKKFSYLSYHGVGKSNLKMKKATYVLFFVFTITCCKETSSPMEYSQLKQVDEFMKENFNSSVVSDGVDIYDRMHVKCPNLQNRIIDVLGQSNNCTQNIDMGSNTYCSAVRKYFMPCTQPGAELLQKCLPEEYKDIPRLFQRMLLAFIDQACNSTVEEIIELFNPCAVQKKFVNVPECIEFLNIFKTSRAKVPDKGVVCRSVSKLRECIKMHQEASCKNPITKGAIMHFYEAVRNAIKDDCDVLNGLTEG